MDWEYHSYCLVPDCDEQPYPGDEMCMTHQREELRFITDAVGRIIAPAQPDMKPRPTGPWDDNTEGKL